MEEEEEEIGSEFLDWIWRTLEKRLSLKRKRPLF